MSSSADEAGLPPTSSATIESPFPSSFQVFSEESIAPEHEKEYSTYIESDSPFPSIYELENPLEHQGIVAPEMEEYVAFLNELYDEEFDDAISACLNPRSANPLACGLS